MTMQSALGLVIFLFLAWCLSERRRTVAWRMIVSGLALQFLVAALMLKVPFFRQILLWLNALVAALEEATRAGTSFVFGYLGGGVLPFAESRSGASFILAFQTLPLVILIAALTSLLFYWRILPLAVRFFSLVLRRTMGIGGALGVGTAGTIFLGMVEAPLLIKPYLARMTRSELFALMSVGLACIAGTMLAIYASLLREAVPDSTGQILTASVIHAPAALLLAALLVPETGAPTLGHELPKSEASGSMDALCRGTWDGLTLFLNIVAMLIVFVALVKLVNLGLGLFPDVLGAPATLERLLGFILAPAAWLTGVPWSESAAAGSLLGTKVALNELIAYIDMTRLPAGALSAKSRLIMAYVMCSFSNLGSVGILVAGLGTLCPERRAEIVSLSMKALLAGVMASLMTGAVIGVLDPY
ncbi:MAG: nucleoside:proton symporter [Desulfovibrionaceae bacterium]|nr:nucleoside:proton symporter [Desulfovibrionaceae bacterium]MBF0513939.1 nucleoside:proton symporter [Desulfovibrionaceae bacterium]